MATTGILLTTIVTLAATVVCAAPTCSSVGPNLITNPGFEASSSSISPWYLDEGTSGTVTKPGENSANALDIAIKLAPDGGQPGFGQNINPICAGDHLFAFDYKFQHQGPNAGLVVNALGGNSGLELTKQSNTTWTNFAEYYPNVGEPGENVTQFSIYPQHGSPMDNGFLFDNVKLIAAGNVVTKSGAQERVNNGGFETGKLSPWTTFPNSGSNLTVITPGLAGSKYALAVGPQSGQGYIQQNVTLTQGSHYEFSLSYSYPKQATGQSIASVVLQTQGGSENTITGSVGTYTGFGAIQKGLGSYNRRFVAHASTTLISITFNFGSTAATLTVDNISIKEIQKPVGA